MKANLVRISLTTLQVGVPFDFIVGNRTVHAGRYTVNDLGVQGAMLIKCSGCEGTAIAMGPELHSIVSRTKGRVGERQPEWIA